MTARDVYEGALFELNKVHAPALTVEEFIYFINKAILAFVNERYNFYAVNQQLSDDLRILLTEFSVELDNTSVKVDLENVRYILGSLNVSNYLHILSCDLIVKNLISNALKRYMAKRLTLDMYGSIYNNEYLKPALNRPYYLLMSQTSIDGDNKQNDSIFKIFIGDDVKNIVPSAARIFYLRLPVPVTLTDDQVYNLVADDSQQLEFPDYLKNELVKRVVFFQLESTRDQRISTFPAFNQEILTVPLEIASSVSNPQQVTTQQST